MELDRNLDGLLERLYELVSIVGLKKSRHILDTDRVSTHILECLCVICEILCGVDLVLGICGITDSRLNVSLFLDSCLYSCLKVAGIVERIKNSEYIYTVCN